jgi:hypothetical protein
MHTLYYVRQLCQLESIKLPKNLSNYDHSIKVSHIIDGHTIQDLLDGQIKPGEYIPRPNWLVEQQREILSLSGKKRKVNWSGPYFSGIKGDMLYTLVRP